ncbi:hypothetical protein H8356DRAFT_1329589 [Neocallimastix lanati (nom. inval.)]|nr:hypothetical protein H8356DRAFT_1329589 [Neocallimastix sp. JGI-2020a]
MSHNVEVVQTLSTEGSSLFYHMIYDFHAFHQDLMLFFKFKVKEDPYSAVHPYPYKLILIRKIQKSYKNLLAFLLSCTIEYTATIVAKLTLPVRP